MTDQEKLAKVRELLQAVAFGSARDYAQRLAENALRIIDAPEAPEKPQSPGDELAREIEDLLLTNGESIANHVANRLHGAVSTYRGRQANEPTVPLIGVLHTAGVPDPKKSARYLLDALTGGSLSSLVCAVRDELSTRRADGPSPDGYVRLRFTQHEIDNLKSNLRALGEDLP